MRNQVSEILSELTRRHLYDGSRRQPSLRKQAGAVVKPIAAFVNKGSIRVSGDARKLLKK
jgi:hypothetical protein